MEQHTDFFKFKNYLVFYRIFNKHNNTGKGILFLHGKSTHSKYLEHITGFPGSEQYMFFAFDYPGKGMSSGKRGDFDSYRHLPHLIDQFVESVIKTHNIQSLHIIGESYGAAVAFHYCREHRAVIGIEGLVFLPGIYRVASFDNIRVKVYLHLFGTIFPSFQHPVSTVPLSRFTNEKKYRDMLVQDGYFDRKASVSYLLGLYKFIRYMNRHIEHHAVPLLVFHGSEDNYTSRAVLLDFYNKIPGSDKKLVILEPGQHWLLGSEHLDRIKKELSVWLC